MDFCSSCVFDTLTQASLFEIPLNQWLKAKTFKVYDGDTCRFMIEINNGIHAFKARLLHINTAEMKTHCMHEKHMAYVARDRARQLLKQKIVYVRCTGTDKYGRKLVTICLNNQQEMYHEVILREQLAYAYEGVRKFADEVLSPTEQEQICPTCMKDEKSKINCIMWQRLRQEQSKDNQL